MKKKWIFLLLGLISGLIVCFIMENYLRLSISAGLIFGLIFAVYYKIKEKKDYKNLISWILISTGAFMVSYFSYFGIISLGRFVGEAILAILYLSPLTYFLYFIPGLLGGAIMIFGFDKFLNKLNKKQKIIIILTSGLIGLFLLKIHWFFLLSHLRILFYYDDCLIFIYWNTIIGFLIGFFVDRNEKEIKKSN